MLRQTSNLREKIANRAFLTLVAATVGGVAGEEFIEPLVDRAIGPPSFDSQSPIPFYVISAAVTLAATWVFICCCPKVTACSLFRRIRGTQSIASVDLSNDSTQSVNEESKLMPQRALTS